MLFGDEHVKEYQRTDGQVGHDWEGTQTLLLTTKGRKSGEQRTTPLIYQEHDGDYLIVASNGGQDNPPAWYLNLQEDPSAHVQVWGDRFEARIREAGDDEKPEMWSKMTETWPAYDDYQEKTDRLIPIVVLERAG